MLSSEIQDPPFCIQVELTEGCNLRCPFCGLQGIRDEGKPDFKAMSLEDAEHIAAAIAETGWNVRLEFAMHGEPTMNKNHLEILATFRRFLPRNYMLMESNGGGIVSKKDPVKHILAMLESLNCLALDEYKHAP